ncbi:hypothetical protein CsSME_00044338 [Camellia sinensis var. sinensis]
MVNGRNKGSSADVSFVKPGTSRRNLSSFQSQAVQSEAGKNFTEMGGRGSSDFYRNTSEELFLKSLMESSIGMPIAKNSSKLGSQMERQAIVLSCFVDFYIVLDTHHKG